ncbi:PREDICTED: probable pectate lyase 9 [Erythranthe guttata]|uniref:probable pectate lyase 9 n=1 Tax=Erythranthe guttata TaxID=4155 RepID=UPI00064D82CD|nr:PREDICTED: probable pectate lyase 9 [Erythranthe guttata]|eukprot:XP_012856511.1 PREDICTED: probable pectate lyase 9 [Erythranthe guttata]
MVSRSAQGTLWCFIWAISIAVLLNSGFIQARRTIGNMNVIDKCWRTNPNWRSNRHQLATCSVGYVGKMRNNTGPDVTNYKVTDPSDDALDPKPGTLRYAMTSIKGKVWITFQRDMSIKLEKPLLVNSFTTIDGRGVIVDIAYGACLLLQEANNVIIHGLRIHDCVAQGAGPVMGPNGKIVQLGPVDGDAIRMVGSSKIWVDHNTLFDSHDGLIDVTRGSTDITISNNWFRFQDKVMLLGHDDGFQADKGMKVTVAFNHFGPHCQQRMPRYSFTAPNKSSILISTFIYVQLKTSSQARAKFIENNKSNRYQMLICRVRFGYAHVVNNLYLGWGQYAIGGSMNPNIKSQANLFIAPEGNNKEVCIHIYILTY